MKPLTLQEAKDQVAKKHSLAGNKATWDKWRQEFVNHAIPQRYQDEAAQLFGDSQYNRALEDAISEAENAVPEMLTSDQDDLLDRVISKLKRLKR